jgi:hypothetical protein
MTPSRGYLTLAARDPVYLEMAVDMALSLREHTALPIALAADEALGVRAQTRYAGIFDVVTLIPQRFREGRALKYGTAEASPFEETMFVDADCIVLASMDDRWSALERSELAMTGELLTTDEDRRHHGFSSYRSYVQAFGAGELAELLRAPPAQPWDALGRAFKASKGADALDRLIRADLLTQLPDDLLLLTDKMTMATSLECRVPILDHEVVELSARMPSRMKIRGRTLKHVLKRALRGLLPDEILFRKKRGFGAPMGAWLKGELAGLIGSVLSRESVEARGLFSWPAVERTLALHAANKADHTDHLLSLMNLEIWCRMTLDGRTPDDVTSQLTAELVS